jgi:hypothetical protein
MAIWCHIKDKIHAHMLKIKMKSHLHEERSERSKENYKTVPRHI